MKQKIVIKVQMNCGKCKSKALQTAASVNGVVSELKLEGEDKVVVTGDDLDTVGLTRALKKKVGHATIVSVNVIEEPAPAPPPPAPAPPAPAENNDNALAPIAHHQHWGPWQPFPHFVVW